MKKLIVTILLIQFSFNAIAEELKSKPVAEGYANPYLYFIDGGDVISDESFFKSGYFEEGISIGAFYRVGFVISEIYTHLVIELITFGEENSDRKIRESYSLSGFDIADSIGVGKLTGVKLVKWNSPIELNFSTGDGSYRIFFNIIIGDEGKFEIVKLSNE